MVYNLAHVHFPGQVQAFLASIRFQIGEDDCGRTARQQLQHRLAAQYLNTAKPS